MKTIAIMPIKLKNERLPGKNTKLLGGKPLLRYELDNLCASNSVDEIYVYCSSEEIIPLLPKSVKFLKRPEYLDLPTSNFTQIFSSFMAEVDSEVYIYAHATAPFVSVQTINECISAVISEKYDSAFCAAKIQDYLWQDGQPLNFDPCDLPRSQDIRPIYRETSGVYVFTKDVFKKYKRRIGVNPYIKEVGLRESVDINNPEDFALAEILLNIKEVLR